MYVSQPALANTSRQAGRGKKKKKKREEKMHKSTLCTLTKRQSERKIFLFLWHDESSEIPRLSK